MGDHEVVEKMHRAGGNKDEEHLKGGRFEKSSKFRGKNTEQILFKMS